MQGVINEITGSKGDSDFFNASTIATIRKQLDSKKIDQKLYGMKRIIAMMSKGENVENFFPDVVKQVITKNISFKKLVYLYLLHYAEKRQQEALLSVNNFKKDLQDRNQFIRALALRVMSGIKVEIIVEIVLNSIKTCLDDKSPYVKKAAAIATTKVYAQAPNLKGELIDIIMRLFEDRNTMVLGAACYAFNTICPENFNLIHKFFKKMCQYLVDCDEWGQSEMLNLLFRYGRSQFLSPFSSKSFQKQKFYDDEDSEETYESDEESKKEGKKYQEVTYSLDEDHRLLLTSILPLLRTNNTGVILQVISLYYHLAPTEEFTSSIVIPLMSLINTTSRENQFTIFTNVCSLCSKRPDLFRPYLTEFFIFYSDPLYIKNLKLKILVSLATVENVSTILTEFKSCLSFISETFVGKTIKAISAIAEKIPSISESCIYGLMRLLSHDSNFVVAQSIVSIQQLIQKEPKKYVKIIKKICTLIQKIRSSEAKACIIWMTGEYYDLIPTIGPDMLRLFTKSFAKEEKIVKMQILTLGTKLFLKVTDDSSGSGSGDKKGEGKKKRKKKAKKSKKVKNLPQMIDLLYKYLLSLSKYDENYDVRDRARFLRHLIFNDNEKCDLLTEKAEKLIFSTHNIVNEIRNKKKKKRKKKKSGKDEENKEDDNEDDQKDKDDDNDLYDSDDEMGVISDDPFYNRDKYIIGSLSHLVNDTVDGYIPLRDFPTEISVENKKIRSEYGEFGPSSNMNKFVGKESESDIGIDNDEVDIFGDDDESFYGKGGIVFTDSDDEDEGEEEEGEEGEDDEEGDDYDSGEDEEGGEDDDFESEEGEDDGEFEGEDDDDYEEEEGEGDGDGDDDDDEYEEEDGEYEDGGDDEDEEDDGEYYSEDEEKEKKKGSSLLQFE